MAISGQKTRSVFDRYHIVSERDRYEARGDSHRYRRPMVTTQLQSGRTAKMEKRRLPVSN